MRLPASCLLLTLVLLGPGLPSVHAEDAKMVYGASATAKYVAFPGVPTCMTGSVQNGDPSKGASVILTKAASGCRIPWHWHTPNEQVMMVSGSAKGEMKDGSPVMLHAGDYLSLPGKSVHRFTCIRACSLFLSSDGVFDMHYVDESGKEITPEEAIKTAAEAKTPAKPAEKE
jgi:quercetin dioxygenase-like cupin family protein